MGTTKFKIGLTSALAIGCAGLTYVILRKKYGARQDADVFENLHIEVVTTEIQCADVVEELRRRCTEHKAVGFDCEWVTVNGKRQPVALVQLSSLDGYCGLFRLSQMENIPESLQDFLEDECIYKVGVAPGDDAKYLAQDYSVFLQSSVDIRHLALLCGHDPGGLASLSKTLLGVILDKSWRIRCSDWSAEALTDKQVRYAAADAHVAIRIFALLTAEYSRRGRLARLCGGAPSPSVAEVCAKYADVSFKTKQSVRNGDLVNEQDKKGGKGKRHDGGKAKSNRYPQAMRTKPLYHNCYLQAPDGELLCTCDIKKAQWYIEKQLADIVTESPLTVRLRFEPAGRSSGDVGKYYQLAKLNRCVVCGADNSYIRKNVVPREYRRFFPEVMKDHSSHDVVLLCMQCHKRSNTLDQGVRERLAARCGAPIGASEQYTEDPQCKKIRSAARALLHQSERLPAKRREELEATILKYFPLYDKITPELLEEAARIQVLFENAGFESHGHKVVQSYTEGAGLLRLEEEWRKHFLDSMRPQHMPEHWSLHHNEERLRVLLNEGRLSEENRKLIGL